MNYNKIHIIGGPGSGKTYCAERLSQKLNIKNYDLDNIFWDKTVNKYGIKNSKDKRQEELAKILEQGSYILEGVYYDWLEESFKKADLIIVLKTSVWIRDCRIIRRFIKRKLGTIESKKETFKDFYNLIKWNHRYDKRNLKDALRLIKEHNNNIIFASSYQDLLEKIFKNYN